MSIHLVYPHGEMKAAPWSIGNHLAKELSADGFEVEQYDWAQRVRMHVERGDILLGHPHEDPGYAFTDNLWRPFKKRIALAPWNGTEAYTKRLELPVDYVFAICSGYWAKQLPPGWTPIDMAVDIEDYPFVKDKINERRKVLYIGCTLPEKGTDYLGQIAGAMPGVEFSHVGPGLIPNTYPYGMVRMDSDRGREIVKEHDILISCGRHDANPTTILEAMAWGLIPICTEESGWPSPPCQHIPLDNVERAVTILKEWLTMPDEKLKIQQAMNLELVKTKYNWDNFIKKIEEVL